MVFAACLLSEYGEPIWVKEEVQNPKRLKGVGSVCMYIVPSIPNKHILLPFKSLQIET